MNRPEIPGFYFDESRKRYFKITNGDQRHHSAYSNNAVEAEKRQKKRKMNASSKITREYDHRLIASSVAQKFSNTSHFPQWLLNRRLDQASHPLGLVHLIASSPAISKLCHFPSWPSECPNKFFLARGRTLELHEFMSFLDGETPPIAKIDLLGSRGEISSRYRIQMLHSKGDWVFCWYGSFFHLMKWPICESRSDCHVVEYTDTFIDSLNDPRHGQNVVNYDMMLDNLLDSRMFPVFCEDELILFSERGHKITASLNPIHVSSIQFFQLKPQTLPQNDSSFEAIEDMIFYSSGKHLVAITGASKQIKWTFKFPIYRFYAISLAAKDSPKTVQKLMRIYIITAKEVIIRDLVNETLQVTGSDIIIPIHNDNQARPLIYMEGQYILIEEGDEAYRVIDTKNLSTGSFDLNVKLSSPRGCMPRMFNLANRRFISDTKSTYVI